MIAYSDMDGTMVGPGGNFFRSPNLSITLEPARALADFLTAGHLLVLVSGRTRAQLIEAAAIFGADGYVAELGAIIGWDRSRAKAEFPGAGPRADDALVDALLTAFPGRLEFHDPWHIGHEVDVMLRGNVPDAETRAWLDAHGGGHLDMRDNGVLPPGRPTGLDPTTLPVHVYHLLPQGISKGAAVAWDLERRGLARADAIAVGDSTSDLQMAPEVSRFFLVANGSAHVHAPLAPNVTVTAGAHGLGWAEAIRSTLA
jgi:hydroxymethylpyrimidine pyrophosphatase-like HAD family hydrolase